MLIVFFIVTFTYLLQNIDGNLRKKTLEYYLNKSITIVFQTNFELILNSLVTSSKLGRFALM